MKISRLGGVTNANMLRNVCNALGLQVTIEDTWGEDVVSAASAHLAASTRPSFLLTVSFMNDWTNEHVAGHNPRSIDGFGSAPRGPGLGSKSTWLTSGNRYLALAEATQPIVFA